MYPIWVGFFEVTGSRDNTLLEGNIGAFLWIAAQTEDASKLLLRVKSVMSDMGLTLVDGEQIQEVVDEEALSEEVAALIPEARLNVDSVVCGTWHRFHNHDA